MSEKVKVTRQGDVLCIGFNRPEKLNAMDIELYVQLGEAYGQLEADSTLRCGLLYGEGKHFTAGLELENIAVGMPELADAAVIAATHKKWDERPLLIAVKAEGQDPSEKDILAGYEGKIASWQLPDAVVFVDELPRNATGKVLKNKLRDQYGDYLIKE